MRGGDMARHDGRSPSTRSGCLSAAAFWLLSIEGAEELDRVADLGVDVEAEALAACEAEQVRRLVASLPGKERVVVQLRYGLGGRPMSCREAAAFLSISISTVAAREHRALERLRRHYSDELIN